MSGQTIICPHCQKEIPLTEAFAHEIEDKLKKEFAAELAKKEAEISAVKKSVEEKLEEERKKILSDAKNQASKDIEVELKQLRDEAKEKEEKLKAAREMELELRKQKNILEEQKKEFELQVQRQLDEERKKIQEKTAADIFEQQRLKDKEKDLQIDQLKKLLEEAQRKANQGSQQMQGEVQELDLEQALGEAFPDDEIQPVGKGIMGADVRQIVKSPRGTVCGSILWESKRTKTWGGDWIAKLKDNMLSDKSNICAIVSEVLPDEAKTGIGLKEGVWVASLKLAVPLSMLLRKSLLDVTKQKYIAEKAQDKAQELYDYVTGHDFQHQVEAMVQTYKEMQDQIGKERVAFEKSWKVRETQVNKLLMGIANIYGGMQGIAGPSLPPVRSLELSEETEPQSKLM